MPGSTPPNAEEILAQQKSFPLVRGIRSKPVTSRSPGESVAGAAGSMQDPKWLAGLRLLRKFGLSWDLRVPTWHLEEAAQVVRANPGYSGGPEPHGLSLGPERRRARRCGGGG